MFVEDLAVLFADFGVTAVYGSLTALVVLDMPDQQVLGGMQISADYAITYRSVDLVGLKHGDALTVDGTSYTVREVTRLDDGRITHATLKR